MTQSFPRIIAHRGSPKLAPENTLASFRRAAADGAKWVEFDASLTADQRVVVFHDDDLDRTSDGSGPLAQTTFDVIANLDAGSWFAPQFRGEMIPTLEEAIELFSDLDLAFNIELKVDHGREVELATVALPIASSIWGNRTPTPIISSFSRQALAAAKEILPAWPRAFLFDHLPDDWRDVANTIDIVSLNGNQRHFDAQQVAAIKDAGYGVLAYTVNERGRAEALFEWGVDGIFTDIPGEMVKAFPEI